MAKMFTKFKKYYVQSKQLLGYIEKAQRFSEGHGYDSYYENEESLERLLDKILILAKQEKEWYCYFLAFYELLFLLQSTSKDKKIIKCAEIFYHDCVQYLDTAISQYPDEDLGIRVPWSYQMIYATYSEFPQITDEKMDFFMEEYRKAALKYGGENTYYDSMLRLALMYRDVETARQSKEKLDQCKITSCYLHTKLPVLGYYLLCGDDESLEQMIYEFRARTIPVQYRWCYKECKLAEDKTLVDFLLQYCLDLGRSDYFHKLLEEYKELFRLCNGEWHTDEVYFYACTGGWAYVGEHIEIVEEDVRDWNKEKYSPLQTLHDCLCWHCYFTMLDRQGTHEVATALAGKEIAETKSGECSCLELAVFFEKEADNIGAQMEASRKKFDYRNLKQTYRTCIGI